MSTAVMNTPMFDCGDHLFKNGMQTKPKDPTPGGHAPLRRSYTSIVTLIEQHRKLDRTVSEPTSRYKTELCHPFEESGTCKYGDKCQFAHGNSELRNLARHPKYKTELCRTFHTIGFCPYGPRCHFIHNIEEARIHNQKVCAQLHGGQPPNIMGLSPLLNASVANLNVNLSLLEMAPPMPPAPSPLLRTNSLSTAQQVYSPPLMRTNSLSLTTQHNLLLCQNSAVARPKPLNLSPTFSLGSTGDSVSPSSSLSQSPTNSMASFFSDDTTNQPATAFNFGQDFSLLAARQSPSPTDDLAPRTPSPLSPNGESRLPVFNRISSTIGDFDNLKI